MSLTAVALTVGQSLGEFRPHVDIEMLGQFIFDPSSLQAASDHFLDPRWIQSVEHIADPLLVNVDPITGIWHVLEQVGVRLRMLKEVRDGETFNLWDC